MLYLLFLSTFEALHRCHHCELLHSLLPRILGLAMFVGRSYDELTCEERVCVSYPAWTGQTYLFSLNAVDHDVERD
jgi:hypothetical protein